ncbi:MAG: hypothetical protein OXR66_06760 [Candidatus Woesearchaeota archaeon]|nr:hypothetical protein [Candidatus Woesearchaeota archaeon]
MHEILPPVQKKHAHQTNRPGARTRRAEHTAQQEKWDKLHGKEVQEEQPKGLKKYMAAAQAKMDAHYGNRPAKKTQQAKQPVEQKQQREPAKRTARPVERKINTILGVALIVALVLLPIIAFLSLSPLANVFLGLLPLFVTLIICIILTNNHFKMGVLWLALLLVHVVCAALLTVLNPVLAVSLNVSTAVILSFVVSCVTLFFCQLAESDNGKHDPKPRKHVVAFQEEKLPEYVQSIEDKAKGINFAIGRVFKASNGGDKELREKLRIPREWYDEFNVEKDILSKKKHARTLVKKIHGRLAVLAKPVATVLSAAERKSLKNIMMEENDTVLAILKKNDNDPVENYYVSAVDFCERILQELK